MGNPHEFLEHIKHLRGHFSGDLDSLTKQLISEPSFETKAGWWKAFSHEVPTPDFATSEALWNQLFEDETFKPSCFPRDVHRSNLSHVIQKKQFSTFDELYEWSIRERAAFWEEVTTLLDISFTRAYETVLDDSRGVHDPRWFHGATLNIGANCFRAQPEKTALITGNEQGQRVNFTYGVLDELSNRVANGLLELGLQPQARIVLFLPFTVEAIAAYLGIIKAGMTVVSVADSFSAEELAKRIAISEAELVISCEGYSYNGKWLNVYEKIKASNAPITILSTYTSPDIRETDILWENFLPENSAFTPYVAGPEHIVNILFSSGTTKAPKAIPWTQLTPIKSAMDGYFHQDIHPDDVVTWTTGMGWMMAPWLIFATLLNKATISLFTGAASHPAFGDFMESSRTTILGTIPSLVKHWRKSGIMENRNLHIRLWSSTGEPSNEEDYFYLTWLTKFQAPIIEYCGGTEIGGGYITGTLLHPCHPSTFTTPALGTQFYLFDEAGQTNTSQGEVKLVPPGVGLSQQLLNRDHFDEYYRNQPQGPAGEVLRKHGDAYVSLTSPLDGHRYYRSLGRTDDAMNIGGIKVSAVEIEEIVIEHAVVFACAAVSINRATSGPGQLVLFLEVSEATDTQNLRKELQLMINDKLNPLFRIGDVVIMEKLPRTASNKVMRRKLRDAYPVN